MRSPAALDAADPLARWRGEFFLPAGQVYLDGNSLGPLPKAARERVATEIDTGWGSQLIRAWNESAWIDLPDRVGDMRLDLGDRAVVDQRPNVVGRVDAGADLERRDRRLQLRGEGVVDARLHVVEDRRWQ